MEEHSHILKRKSTLLINKLVPNILITISLIKEIRDGTYPSLIVEIIQQIARQ